MHFLWIFYSYSSDWNRCDHLSKAKIITPMSKLAFMYSVPMIQTTKMLIHHLKNVCNLDIIIFSSPISSIAELNTYFVHPPKGPAIVCTLNMTLKHVLEVLQKRVHAESGIPPLFQCLYYKNSFIKNPDSLQSCPK